MKRSRPIRNGKPMRIAGATAKKIAANMEKKTFLSKRALRHKLSNPAH